MKLMWFHLMPYTELPEHKDLTRYNTRLFAEKPRPMHASQRAMVPVYMAAE